jgi:SulP family sulfate permease
MRAAMDSGAATALGLPREFIVALPFGGTTSGRNPRPFSDQVLRALSDPTNIAMLHGMDPNDSGLADIWSIQGVANLAAGVSGGYPVGGSFSRSALNHGAGAMTRASGAITGLAVLAFLPFAGILEPLPKAVLAAIVITAVLGLIRLRRMVALWRVSRPQFAVAWTTFVLTLVLTPRVERAVMAGVALAVHLVRELTMRIETTTTGDTLEVRPTGVLWFATAQDLEERLIDLLEEHRDIDRLRLVLDGLGRIDLTGAMSLDHLLDDARAAGVEVEVVGAPPQARGLLDRYGRRKDALR